MHLHDAIANTRDSTSDKYAGGAAPANSGIPAPRITGTTATMYSLTNPSARNADASVPPPTSQRAGIRARSATRELFHQFKALALRQIVGDFEPRRLVLDEDVSKRTLSGIAV